MIGKLKEVDKKITVIKERHALGKIEDELYHEFGTKYKKEQHDIQEELDNLTISSSNLEKCIDRTLDISSNLSEMWVSGDFTTKLNLQEMVFPDGILYNRKNDLVRTCRTNTLFAPIPLLSKALAENKSGQPIKIDKLSSLVTPGGLDHHKNRNLAFYPVELRRLLRARKDSNPQPSDPKSDILSS